MVDDSHIGRIAQDMLEALDPDFQRLIETSTDDERKTYQHLGVAYVAKASGEPYGFRDKELFKLKILGTHMNKYALAG